MCSFLGWKDSAINPSDLQDLTRMDQPCHGGVK
jgi:hypothetical protein